MLHLCPSDALVFLLSHAEDALYVPMNPRAVRGRSKLMEMFVSPSDDFNRGRSSI